MIKSSMPFLVACTRLCNSLCPTNGWSVGRSVALFYVPRMSLCQTHHSGPLLLVGRFVCRFIKSLHAPAVFDHVFATLSISSDAQVNEDGVGEEDGGEKEEEDSFLDVASVDGDHSETQSLASSLR